MKHLIPDQFNKGQKIHYLKTWPKYFIDVWDLRKSFEIRQNDRYFKQHEVVCLQEYDPKTEEYTGVRFWFEISYVLKDAPDFGLMPGFAILGMNRFSIFRDSEGIAFIQSLL